jgi:hypothetical protein
MGEERTVYKVLVGKPEEKKPLERPGNRWEDEIRMDLRVFFGGGAVCSVLSWLRTGTGGGLL